jgi:hypothetical protein
MKIESTEFDYEEEDKVCLEYYLCEQVEDFKQWATRVWQNCERHKQGLKTDITGNKLASVYARDPHELWEEKKRRRRAAFVKQCTGEECDPELLDLENIKEDVKEKIECKWPKSHSSAEILRMKGDPKIKYKTATEEYEEEDAKDAERIKILVGKRISNVATLRTKFDDETIAIIYPEGAGLL